MKYTKSLNFQAVNKFFYPLLLFEESGKVMMHIMSFRILNCLVNMLSEYSFLLTACRFQL